MQTNKTRSWKGNIDPAFDELIKVYMDFIRLSHICDNNKSKRYLFLDAESLKILERKSYPPLSQKPKPNPRKNKKTANDIINLGASADILNILKVFNFKDGTLSIENIKAIFNMMNGLPTEESKTYYRKHFDILQSPEKLCAFIEGKSSKEIEKHLIGLGMELATLMFHTGLKGYWDDVNRYHEGKKVNKLNIISMVMLQVYNAISIIAYKKPLTMLIEEARKGNEKSLFSAIHLDKTLFDVKWVRKRIRKAFYSGDSDFLKQLGKAIIKPPLANKVIYGEIVFILAIFWPMGLYRLKNEELMELLKDCGIMMPKDKNGNESSESLRKYISRLKRDNVLTDFDKLFNES